MKYIHFFPYEKFTAPYIDFINKNYNSEEHLFVLHGDKSKHPIKKYENTIDIGKDFKSKILLLKYLFKSKKIIMHSLSGYLTLLLALNPWLLKKSFWVIWDGDLYNFNKHSKKIEKKLANFTKIFVINNIHGICTLVKGDFDLAEKKFNLKGRYYPAAYINPIKTDYLDKIYNEKNITKEVINIQIGNSADISNKHFEILNLLSKYRNENIQIYAPLSYGGDLEYIETVKAYGEELFGEKFLPMVDFLSPDIYTKYLADIDVAIFANERQQALGNIFALVYLEKKIYIRNDISTWEYLYKDINVEVFNYNNIKNENFEEFSNSKIKKSNKKNIVKVMNESEIKKKWDLIFK